MAANAPITSVAELLAHAHAMEQEAHERYEELAEQLEMHNNPEVAALFRKMAEVERQHVAQILARVGDLTLPHIPPWEYKWEDAEPPQSVDTAEVHYLMTPAHALRLALKAEERALAFYTRIVDSHEDPDILALARSLQEEEEEHVSLMRAWLAKFPDPEDGWDEDPDPPAQTE